MIRFISVAAATATLMLAAACASFAPEDPDLINDRLRPGPGLLSGAKGEFLLLRADPDTARPEAD